MPFDFKSYDREASQKSVQQLQLDWEHYTRLISGGATSTTVSGLAFLPTLGLSSVGIAFGSASIHNARKKRDIIDKYLALHGAKHHTRFSDVAMPVTISGVVSMCTLGAGSCGGDMVVAEGASHAISSITENQTATKVVTKVAVEGLVLAAENEHAESKRAQEALRM